MGFASLPAGLENQEATLHFSALAVEAVFGQRAFLDPKVASGSARLFFLLWMYLPHLMLLAVGVSSFDGAGVFFLNYEQKEKRRNVRQHSRTGETCVSVDLADGCAGSSSAHDCLGRFDHGHGWGRDKFGHHAGLFCAGGGGLGVPRGCPPASIQPGRPNNGCVPG